MYIFSFSIYFAFELNVFLNEHMLDAYFHILLKVVPTIRQCQLLNAPICYRYLTSSNTIRFQ